MSTEISEARFEEDIQFALLIHGGQRRPVTPTSVAEQHPDAYGADHPGGYHQPPPRACDRALCLIPDDLIAFVQATQPEAWERLREHHGDDLRDEFVRRVSGQVTRRGLLSCLREGMQLTGQRIRLAYFRPVSGLNRELRTLYEGNLFSVVRQLRYSDRNENSLDLVLFLNGLPYSRPS